MSFLHKFIVYDTTPNYYEYFSVSFKRLTYRSNSLSSGEGKYSNIDTTNASVLFHQFFITLVIDSYPSYRYIGELLMNIFIVIQNILFSALLPITCIYILDWTHYQI